MHYRSSYDFAVKTFGISNCFRTLFAGATKPINLVGRLQYCFVYLSFFIALSPIRAQSDTAMNLFDKQKIDVGRLLQKRGKIFVEQ